ncbi:MAG: UDP-N-acetylmuramoyl-tripeptide--D-alanyl-D-alanine ligase [Tepidisphaeraceae bacterium]
MKPLTIQQIRQAVGGKALTAMPKDAPLIRSVWHDSKQVEPFSLFVAIKGPRVNGHDFLPEAVARGAVAALVDEPLKHVLPNLHLIGVEDTRRAMGRLATFVRQKMSATVIAVAGSNGKTTTKYFIDSVLSPHKKGSISPKSYNNDVGVPLAIFPADPLQDYLVLEIGTNHHGEVQHLSEMTLPDIAVITNVGAEHLEGLGDLDGVRREEASIVMGLNPKGCLIVNGDDEGLVSLVSRYPGQIVKFGFNTSNDLFATDIHCGHDGVYFNLNGSARRRVFVPMLGRHSACNALAAIAVGRKMNLPEEAVIESLAHAHGPDMRLQLSKVNGVTVLNDAYNANPSSTRAAIETLVALPSRGRKVAVLGDMLELGEHSDSYHRETGELAASSALDLLICVGKKARLIAASAKAAGMEGPRIVTYPDALAAARGITRRVRSSDLILLKGSRSVGLEAVAKAISEREKKFARRAAG